MKFRIAGLLVLSLLLSVSTYTRAAGVTGIPDGLKWEEPGVEPLIASDSAVKGGTLHDRLISFPLTFRQVGPDSNGGFRSFLDANDMGLVILHPNEDRWIPGLATKWAIDKNGRTAYYQLDPKARWSDGKPVIGADFVFALEFFRSKHIKAPWYNTYYSEQIEAIQAFKTKDGHEVVAVTLPSKKPELIYATAMSPQPKHFYKLDKNWVKNYNWKVKPNTGPYMIDKFKKGKSVTFKRNPNWWASDRPWFKNRFNIDKIRLKVIRDTTVSWEYLKKGKLDFMSIPFPDYWHVKSKKSKSFTNGYIHKMEFYNDAPRTDYVLTLNKEDPLLKDLNVRLALSHAMNVEKVIKNVLRGDYYRLQGVSQGYGDFTNPRIKARQFDLGKAKSLLAKSGWVKRNKQGILTKDGNALSIKVVYSSDILTPRLVVLKEEAKKAGIELRLEKLDGSTYWKKLLAKKHQIGLVSWGTGYRPQYWGQYHSANAIKDQTNNFANLQNKKLDGLIEKYRASTLKKERISLAHQIQQIIYEEAIQIPLFEVPFFRVAYWSWIKFPQLPATKLSDGLEYFGHSSGGLIWIDTKLKKDLKKAEKDGKKFKEVTRIETKYKVR